MLMSVFFLCFFTFLAIVSVVYYFYRGENTKLDHMVLQNLLTEDEKKIYINEYKNIIACKVIFDHMSDNKNAIEITREVIKSRREK